MDVKAKVSLPPACHFQLLSSRTAIATVVQYAYFFPLPETGAYGATWLIHKPLGLYYQLEKENTLSKERVFSNS